MIEHINRRTRAGIGYMLISMVLPFNGWSRPLGLYEAVEKAVAYYPSLRQRQAEIAADKAHLTTVNGDRLPSLTLHEQLDLGTDNSLQGAYFSLSTVPSTPGSYATVHTVPNTGNIGISYLKWDFYTFGYYNARQREAKARLAVTEAIMTGDKYTLTENVIGLYLDWLKKYRLSQVENENVARASVILTAIRATVMSGLKPGVDSATAAAALSDARLARLQALDNYNNAGIAIASFTGSDDNIFPDTNMFTSPVLASMATIGLPDSIPVDHPLIGVYKAEYEHQLAARETIARKYLPKAGLDAAAWVRNSGISPTGVYPTELTPAMPYGSYNYLFGLTFSYNLFDLKHRHDELVESSLRAEAAEDALFTRRTELSRVIRQLNNTYATTLEKLKEMPVRLNSARMAYGQQVALYKAGLNTLVDVTNAQYALNQAETGYVIAWDDLLQLLYARAALNGRADIFLQNFK